MSIRQLAPIGFDDAVVKGKPVKLPVTTVADWAADIRDKLDARDKKETSQ